MTSRDRAISQVKTAFEWFVSESRVEPGPTAEEEAWEALAALGVTRDEFDHAPL